MSADVVVRAVGGTEVRPPLERRRPLGALVATTVTCLVVSVAGWLPLRAPAYTLGLVIPHGSCRNVQAGSPAMVICGTRSAGLVLLAPFVFTAILFLFRRRVRVFLRRALTPRLPSDWRFLAAPAIATGVFTMGWSYAHSSSWDSVGLIPDICFPTLVGLFAYLTARYVEVIQRRLRGYLVVRDRVGSWGRLAITIVLPSAAPRLAYAPLP